MLTPTIAVVTNIDAEHLDHYGTMARLGDAFVDFANRVPFYGLAVVCLDDPQVAAILPRLTKRAVTYGFRRPADYTAADLRHEGPHTRFHVPRTARTSASSWSTCPACTTCSTRWRRSPCATRRGSTAR